MEKPMVKAENICMYFPLQQNNFLQKTTTYIKAVDGVSLEISRGEVLGLVGETGCGKTTIARCLLRLIHPTRGKVFLNGANMGNFNSMRMRDTRKQIQMIFEDPYLSMDPVMRVGDLIAEPLHIHHLGSHKEIKERVNELLHLVELESYHANSYPRELSGGELQRAGIARALATSPSFVVCDNALVHLDASIQLQLISLFINLREKYDMAYLFIAHDLALVRQISDRVAVMYAGKIVEIAGCDEFFDTPIHPYSQALLAAVPIPDPKIERERKVIILQGERPSPISPPSGCRFHPRCPQAQQDICSQKEPLLREIKNAHFVACHLI